MTEQEVIDPLEKMRETLREKKTRAPKSKAKAWTPVTNDRLAYGTVLAFDQTLSKTGFSVVRHDHTGLHVIEGNLILAATDSVGFEETYAKAAYMEHAIDKVTMFLSAGIDCIVHEMPAVTGHRTESSLMAGYFVRRAAHLSAPSVPVVMLSKRSAAALLIPPDKDRSSKANMTQAVNALIPRENRQTKRWNQDVHDSVALAVLRLHRQKEHAA
jgi:hypothetical protein